MGTSTAPDGAQNGTRGVNSRLLALVVALLLCGAAIGATTITMAQEGATPVATADVAAPVCPAELHGPGAEPWFRAELYFGTTSPDGTPYTEEQWLTFLAEEITPRFPAGLTVLTGLGQWQEEDGSILQERSQVLIILYPSETAAESSALLEEIRDAYEQQFNQTSVLRADITQVCTSF